MQPSHPSSGGSSEPPPDPIFSARSRVPSKATRRIRGEIACAECRRLKIRCDRTIPCSTCVKRGCGALCPNGDFSLFTLNYGAFFLTNGYSETIPPGEGSRFVLAATDHLRHKMTRMEARMRSLEDALAIIQISESDQQHPLLSSREELEGDEGPTLQAFSEEFPQSSSPVLPQASGTLWTDEQGGSRFFGPSGGVESLLISSSMPHSRKSGPVLQDLDPSYFPQEINNCYQSFPLAPPNVVTSSVQQAIESFLPSIDRAITLCDTFLEHLSWMFHIVSRHKMVNELIPVIYKQVASPYGPHDLALLLIVLGVGSLVDLNLPPYNLEAQHYYRLARATLALQPILGAQSVVTIKVLHLMSIYNGMSGKESNLEQSYTFLDLAGQVAMRIGFHIDPSMWKFEGREAYDRRVYFWNLMSGVLWQSLVTGRPPSLVNTYIDCRIPTAEDENLFQEGEVPLGFGIWGFKASQECLIPLARLVLAAKPPNYESVMELDRKIRDLVMPRADMQGQTDRTAISMRIFVRSHYQELMLMYLHRAYFAQAVTENPENPLQSPYSQAQFMKKPLLCARIWRMWTFGFTAAVIVGTIAIRGVHLNLQPPPLTEFEAICKVFESASETSSRAARAMAMLRKAYQAQKYYHEQGRPAPSEGRDVEELMYFGGLEHPKMVRQGAAEAQTPSPISPRTPPNFTNRHPSETPPMSPPPRIAKRSGSLSEAGPGPAGPSTSTYPLRPPSAMRPQDHGHYQHQSQSQAALSSSRVPAMSPSQFADLPGGWSGVYMRYHNHRSHTGQRSIDQGALIQAHRFTTWRRRLRLRLRRRQANQVIIMDRFLLDKAQIWMTDGCRS
ncbi:hypothetical protein CPB84DRAFT_172899 [Gymnopilus junonius]|uniref:Zn(2)-C6 fungal-type domain-containing protein n=1 Tax=Gymnopilus junonius TaxID=109634 RepID=A0A9P5NDQ1_GYMJU|nr:hypothetical protein CPB84DRAFT_172899 [Gymnopilus junonius]